MQCGQAAQLWQKAGETARPLCTSYSKQENLARLIRLWVVGQVSSGFATAVLRLDGLMNYWQHVRRDGAAGAGTGLY